MDAIISSPFGPVILIGEQARAFERQIKNVKHNPAAERALRRGAALVKAWNENGGYVRLPMIEED